MTCPKCGSKDVVVTQNPDGPEPMYLCNKCGYKHLLFPKFEKREDE